MRKKEIRNFLAMLKVQYGDGAIPMVTDIRITPDNIPVVEAIVELASKKYITYVIENIEDDEGIRHGFKRGYRLTQKAKELLEGV